MPDHVNTRHEREWPERRRRNECWDACNITSCTNLGMLSRGVTPPDSILHWNYDQYHRQARNCGIDRAIVAITMLIEVVACSSATRFSFGGEGRGCCTPNFLVGSPPKAKDDKKALPWQEVPTPNCERRNGTLSNAPRPQSESPSKPGVGKIGQRRPIKPPFQRVILCQLVEWPPGLAGEIQQALMNGGCDVFQRLHRVASR